MWRQQGDPPKHARPSALPVTPTITTGHLPSSTSDGNASDAATVSAANVAATSNEHGYGRSKSDDSVCNPTTTWHIDAVPHAPSHAIHPGKHQPEHQWRPNGTISFFLLEVRGGHFRY